MRQRPRLSHLALGFAVAGAFLFLCMRFGISRTGREKPMKTEHALLATAAVLGALAAWGAVAISWTEWRRKKARGLPYGMTATEPRRRWPFRR